MKDEVARLKRELDKVKQELDLANYKLAQVSEDSARREAYFKDNLPVLIGRTATNLTKVSEILGAISIYKRSARVHLGEIRGKVDPVTLAQVESIDFALTKIAELISLANNLCRVETVIDDAPTIIGLELWDYVFSEFKLDSGHRKISINGKTIDIPNSEFQFLIELVKKPNQPVQFDDLVLARTNLSRLKHRVPELKSIIQSVFNTGSYRLVVTPFAPK